MEHLPQNKDQFYPAASYSPATRALMLSFKMKPQWRRQKSSLGRHLPVQKASFARGKQQGFSRFCVDKYDPMPGETPAAQQMRRTSSCSRREQGRKLQRMRNRALWGEHLALPTNKNSSPSAASTNKTASTN